MEGRLVNIVVFVAFRQDITGVLYMGHFLLLGMNSFRCRSARNNLGETGELLGHVSTNASLSPGIGI